MLGLRTSIKASLSVVSQTGEVERNKFCWTILHCCETYGSLCDVKISSHEQAHSQFPVCYYVSFGTKTHVVEIQKKCWFWIAAVSVRISLFSGPLKLNRN